MIVVWVRIKYTILNTKSTIVITTSNPNDSRSSITKFILILFYLIFSIANKFNFPSSNLWIDFVL